jgi:hydrogenase nickel incorporation protein HypA/HybF
MHKSKTMHELSIVMGILEIARKEAAMAGAASIDEIELDIGALSTVDMDAFDFAWNQGVKGTLLAGAQRKVNRIEGRARCMDCNIEFSIREIFEPCPACGEHFIDIVKGKELRVKSLVVEEGLAH